MENFLNVNSSSLNFFTIVIAFSIHTTSLWGLLNQKIALSFWCVIVTDR